MSADGGKANIIRLFNVSKRYGAKLALNDITLDIEPGEFIFMSGTFGGRQIHPCSRFCIWLNGSPRARSSLTE